VNTFVRGIHAYVVFGVTQMGASPDYIRRFGLWCTFYLTTVSSLAFRYHKANSQVYVYFSLCFFFLLD